MAKQTKKDNQTFAQKKLIRQHAIGVLATHGLAQPVVVETNGGAGALYRACYRGCDQGMVLEKDAEKAALLARQRPTWAVYECDNVTALRGGAGGHLEATLLDCDPYGQVWDVLDAFFTSARPFADTMAVVATCGLRNKLRLGGAWDVASMRPIVEKYGNDIFGVYLEISQEKLVGMVAPAGYRVATFAGYYCGVNDNMTHWWALLQRDH